MRNEYKIYVKMPVEFNIHSLTLIWIYILLGWLEERINVEWIGSG